MTSAGDPQHTRTPELDWRWLRRRVLNWFDRHGRAFPWRGDPTPYRVLIAELLLQRTRSDLVLREYEGFIARFPDAKALAAADSDQVVEILRPLGYRHRTERLPRLGQQLVERHGGDVPQSKDDLLELSGVGEYVANAVLAVAFGERRALLDPNVIRVLTRVTGRSSQHARARDDRALWQFLSSLLPRRRAADFGLALVDLGATVCRPRRPRCHECPLQPRCNAFTHGLVHPAVVTRERP